MTRTVEPVVTEQEGEQSRRGLLSGLAAYGLWGLFPIYWPLLKPAGAVEILSHRVVWTLVTVAVLLSLRGRRGLAWFGELRKRRYAVPKLSGAACVIAVNWGCYIWGVNHGHVVETSLGYFMNPLVTIVLGVVVLREKLRPVQWAAVGIGLLAVVVLAVDYGRPPWLALVLAFSFGAYGLAKKSVGAGPVESLTVETATLAVPALAYLIWLGATGGLTFGHASVGNSALLILSGPVTAIPLLFFGAAAVRLPLTVLGLLQYVAPVLQFAFGVLLFHEDMPAARYFGFGLVWLALVVITLDGLRAQRRTVARTVRAAAL